MKQTNSDSFQELHHTPKEYCWESGPLNSKEGSFPAAVLNGLELVAAALAAMALFNALLSLSIVSSPLSILSNSAYIEVDVRNWPEDGNLTYTLSSAENPGSIIARGEIFSDPQDLELEGLTGETEYILTYYHNEEVIGSYTFSTGTGGTVSLNPVTEPASTTLPQTEPTAAPTTEATTVPTTEETTLPTTEETTAPTTEPVTVPTRPPETKPTTPSKPETTSPPETEPAPPPTTEPEPTPPPETEQITGNVEIISVTDESADGIKRYTFREKHTFTNVTAPYEISVMPEKDEVTHEVAFDADTQTLIVDLWITVSPGETVNSTVTVTSSDGKTGTSTSSVTAPVISFLNVTVSQNELDPSRFDLKFTGNCVLPSVGTLQNARIEISPNDPEIAALDALITPLPDLQLGETFSPSEPLELGLIIDAPVTLQVVLYADWVVCGKTITISCETTVPVEITREGGSGASEGGGIASAMEALSSNTALEGSIIGSDESVDAEKSTENAAGTSLPETPEAAVPLT